MRHPNVTVTQLDDGTPVYEADGVRSLECCEYCNRPILFKRADQRACGDVECQRRRHHESKRARFLHHPESLMRQRLRNRQWSAENRNCNTPNPWLRGAPPYGAHLPGGGVELAVTPHPKWPIEHRNTRALHGMITALSRQGHNDRWPRFALVPWPTRFGWGVYFWEDTLLNQVAGRTMSGRLFDRQVSVRFSPARKIRAPIVTRRGRIRARLDAITTVAIVSDGRTRPHLRATADSIRNSLTQEFPRRLGVEWLDVDDVRIEMVEHATWVSKVHLGGKYGLVRGWEGSCVLEVNGPGMWLLQCAARVGLGSRTAFGFGRIRVTEE